MRFLLYALGAVFVLTAAPGDARAEDEIFEPTDHCVAYRTVKDMWFFVDTPIVGKSCEVAASLTASPDDGAPRISVTLPIESLDSRNRFRDGVVADLLGVEEQPDLRFTSDPLDADALREEIPKGSFALPGILSFGGKEFRVEFPVELSESGGRHFAEGSLTMTFEAFGIEVPTVAGGLIARPHDEIEIAFHVELERVDQLEAWAEQQNQGS